jgi:hypothetical protein
MRTLSGREDATRRGPRTRGFRPLSKDAAALRAIWRSATLDAAMSADDRTDRFRPVFEPEDIFDRFVRNANASTDEVAVRDDEPTGRVRHGRGGPPSWDHEITVRAPSPADDETEPGAPTPLGALAGEDAPPSGAPAGGALAGDALAGDEAPGDELVTELAGNEPPGDELAGDELAGDELAGDELGDEEDVTVPRASPLTDSGQRILLLTRVKRPGSRPPPAAAPAPRVAAPWESVVSPRGLHTQRLEAMRVVPDVEETASRREGGTFVGEGVEDGQMPTRQLDQILSDMAVLLRYGHAGQVRERLEQLRRTYPEDLLLLRRIAEFHVEHEQTEAALEALFALAGGLFERRNVEGMRQALEQVLVLDSDNARAYRLLGLLERRPQDGTS